MPLPRVTEAPRMERRDNSRLAISASVGLTSGNNFYLGVTENLSHGGLFILANDLPPIGSLMQLNLKLPDHAEELHCSVEVRWHRHAMGPDVPSGFGVRFLSLSPADEERVREFIRVREPLVHPGS
jgi:uncharacterized protein (TIGR02266 family)